VPKKMNQLGSAGTPVPGSLLKPDPAAQTAELESARRELAAAEAREHSGHDGDANRVSHEPREVLSGRPSELED
jgi:ubiquinol-cytochrome c reductase cytochrome b subunit